MTSNVVYDPAPSPATRPQALVEAYRTALAEEQAAKSANLLSRRPATFPPLSLGQALRAGFLMLVCVGFAQLVHIGHASAEKAPVTKETQAR